MCVCVRGWGGERGKEERRNGRKCSVDIEASERERERERRERERGGGGEGKRKTDKAYNFFIQINHDFGSFLC